MSTKRCSIYQIYSEWYDYQCQKNRKIWDEDFSDWMDKIETKVKEMTGMNLLDLPDEAYMKFFTDKLSVSDVVGIIVSKNGFHK
jgi:hypothetical protein